MPHRSLVLLGALLLAVLGSSGLALAATGTLVLVGDGPERALFERLAHAFEKTEPGRVVDIRWHRTLKPADEVASGSADVAVAAEGAADLAAVQIAWEGVALIVNFANPVHEITSDQAAALLSGAIRSWSEIGGAERAVEVLRRPPDRHLDGALRTGLRLSALPDAERPLRSDQRVLSAVAGRLPALGYISLAAALEAHTFGAPIGLLLVDGVEPGKPTVADGRYPLRRPVLLLTKPAPPPLVAAFLGFVRSVQGQRIVDEFYVPYRP